jgi:hypothetical protein
VGVGRAGSTLAAPSRRVTARWRAPVRSANGVELEDTVELGGVLFVADVAIQIPLEVELYDAAGKLVGRHTAFSF